MVANGSKMGIPSSGYDTSCIHEWMSVSGMIRGMKLYIVPLFQLLSWMKKRLGVTASW